MSHFSVLVIGPNFEAQLQPFHEVECTGIFDQYVVDVDVTEETRKNGLDWHGLEDKVIEDESQVDRTGAHKWGFAVVKDGVLVKAVNRTNPNKKWDWWTVGGRWSNYFRLKDGTRSDAATLGEVDFKAMRDEEESRARTEFRKARAVLGSAPEPTLRSDRDLMWVADVNQFYRSEDDYADRARAAAVPTFAVVKDSQWFERGSMGWFGCVSDEKDERNWHFEFNRLLESLPPDTQLTLVDCHI